jgi:hypothetical protein
VNVSQLKAEKREIQIIIIIIIIIIMIMVFLSLSSRYNSEIRQKCVHGTQQKTSSVLSSSRMVGSSSVTHATGRGVRIVSDLPPEGIRTMTGSLEGKKERERETVIFSPKLSGFSEGDPDYLSPGYRGTTVSVI